MGREAYLDKIAFGRSAFTPTPPTTHASNYVQLPSAQADIPQRYLEAGANHYVQLYDERGKPINPRSREYAKKLRRAQNDVLASVGVVERQHQQQQHAIGPSGQEEREMLDAEDTAGNAIAVATTLAEHLCTWWIGSIRARVMAFRYPAMSLVQIIAHEWTPALLYAGFPARLLSTISVQALVYGAVVYQPLTRILLVTRASTRTRQLVRRWQGALKLGLRCAIEVLVFPLAYHARLQRLGLVPANQLLPAWRTLVPWSASSPLASLLLQFDGSASVADWLLALVTWPVVLVCVEHFLERWVYACIHEAVESSVLRPENAGLTNRQYADKEWAATMLGRRGQSPRMIRGWIHRVLAFLGWGRPLASDAKGVGFEATSSSRASALRVPESSEELGEEPWTSDDDARIRITSREGMVEMEVHLPSRVLSRQTEEVEGAGWGEERGAVSRGRARRHHVTQLSLEPGLMVGAIVKAQVVSLSLMPLQTMSCRVMARRFAAQHQALAGGWLEGRGVSRLGLCAGLDVGIGLGLWCVQYVGVTGLGGGWFGWGGEERL